MSNPAEMMSHLTEPEIAVYWTRHGRSIEQENIIAKLRARADHLRTHGNTRTSELIVTVLDELVDEIESDIR